jgi:hypothetical protein
MSVVGALSYTEDLLLSLKGPQILRAVVGATALRGGTVAMSAPSSLVSLPARSVSATSDNATSPPPYDVVRQIVLFTNIGNVASILLTMGSHLTAEERESIRRSRFSPIRHLSPLKCSPLAMLALMRNTGTILSGSRAVDYFVPGSCNSDSDWDFYCDDDENSVLAFALWSTCLGVVWDPLVQAKEADEAEDGPYRKAGFSIARGTISTKEGSNPIQLMWKSGMSAAQSITKFHSTVPQCFISGFCAVSLYHHLTSKSMGVSWEHNDAGGRLFTAAGDAPTEGLVPGEATAPEETAEERNTRLDRSLSNQRKYEGRGFKYIEHSEYVEQRQERAARGSEVPGWCKAGSRHIGDSESCVVKLDEYVLPVCKAKPRGYSLLAQGLHRIRWYDWEGYTSPDFGYLKFIMEASLVASSEDTVYYYTESRRLLMKEGAAMDTHTGASFHGFHAMLNSESEGCFGEMPLSFTERAASGKLIDASSAKGNNSVTSLLPC